MTHTYTQRLALLLTAGLATLLVALALTSASASAANEFCGGQTISNIQACYGAPRNLEIIQGWGERTGVCVGYNEILGNCSVGARQLAQYDAGGYAFRYPRIQGNSPNNTTVWQAFAF